MDLDAPGPLTLDPAGNLRYMWPGKGWVEIRLQDVARWRAGTELPVTRHLVPTASNGSMKVYARPSLRMPVVRAPSGANFYDCGDGPHPALLSGSSSRTNNMHEGVDGTMVLWGDSLLAIGRPGSAFRTAALANGLPGLVDAIPGRDGTIWLGTTHGLFRLASGFRMEYWTAREGLPDAPWSLASSGGRIYAGLDRRIVVLSRDRMRWETVATFHDGLVASSLGTADGGLLAGFSTGGAAQLDAAGNVVARTGKNDTDATMRLANTPDGEVWAGNTSLRRLSRSGSTLKLEDHPLETHPSKNLLAIKYEEQTRKLWSCYNGGAVMRDEHGAWKEITTRDGLLVGGCWSLAPLPNGDVWYAYFNLPALALLRPGRAAPIPSGNTRPRAARPSRAATASIAIATAGSGAAATSASSCPTHRTRRPATGCSSMNPTASPPTA